MNTTMKHRIVQFLQKYLFNPPIRILVAIGCAPAGYALLETIRRKTGKQRRTPVGNGLVGKQFWIVAEHGQKAGYVRNIMNNPRVRLNFAKGSKRDGTLAQRTCFLMMTRANASNGSRIKCVAAPGMLLQSASSGLGCSRFGLISNHERELGSGALDASVRFRLPLTHASQLSL